MDTTKVGTYIITYTVTDKAGNVGTKTRTVKVGETASKPDNNTISGNTITTNTVKH